MPKSARRSAAVEKVRTKVRLEQSINFLANRLAAAKKRQQQVEFASYLKAQSSGNSSPKTELFQGNSEPSTGLGLDEPRSPEGMSAEVLLQHNPGEAANP